MLKRLFLIVALVAALIIGSQAWAENFMDEAQAPELKDLEILDALLESGAMNQEAYDKAKDRLAKKTATALRPTGELMVTYTPWNQMDYDEIIEYPGGPEKERGFALQKAAFGLQGRVLYDWLSFKLTASAEQQKDGTMIFGLENGYFRIFPTYDVGSDGHRMGHGFTFGAMKIPFTRQNLTSETNLQFVRRAMVIEEVDITRDIGMTFDAKYNLADGLAVIDLRAGAFNGQGHRVYTTDNNDNLLYAARLRMDFFSPIANGEGDTRETYLSQAGIDQMLSIRGPQLSIGGSFMQNNDIDRVVKAWGIDAEFRWFGLSLLYEYVKSSFEPEYAENLTNDLLADEWETTGWYLQGGYFIWPRHIEVAVRYDEYHLDLLDDISDERILSDTTFGLNLHLATKHRLKFMANYIMRGELEGMPEIDNDSITLLTSLHF
jgi:hypothetical protein